MVESTLALGAGKPVRPIDVVTPIVIDKGGWTNDPYLYLVRARPLDAGIRFAGSPASLCLRVGRTFVSEAEASASSSSRPARGPWPARAARRTIAAAGALGGLCRKRRRVPPPGAH